MAAVKKILLLIEDNPLLVGLYKSAFEKKGFDVFIAHDGKLGLQLAKTTKPELVLLDILMPGMDGLEVLKELKDDPETKKIKVIVLTVVSDQKSQDIAKDLGVLDYLLKPELELKEIVERVSLYVT